MDFVERTVELARMNVEAGGRPFACVIVKDGEVVAEACNQVAQTHDPTAHAEVVAIRAAAKKLGSEHFIGCTFYLMAHPCPMCLAAMYYCSPDRVIFVTVREDYSEFYVDDRKYFTLRNFYDEVGKPWQERAMPMEYQPSNGALDVYRRWKEINQ